MTLTPDALETTAARYDRHYGTRPGDGGTSDMLRAGAQAMRRVEELEADKNDIAMQWGICLALKEVEIGRAEAAEARLAAYEETLK